MHLDFITVGPNFEVERTMNELSAKYLPFKFMGVDENKKFKEGTEQNYAAQIIVREIRFWEAIFPEEHKDLVLSTVLGKSPLPDLFGDAQKKYEKYLWALRKALKLDKIPDYNADFVMPLHKGGTHFVGIGVKSDRRKEGKEML